MTYKVIICVMAILLAGSAFAKNVDLVTLPNREKVQLTIYNSEDITLIKEFRYLTLKRGNNQLQFSWSNTLIDPTSVEFRPLQHQDQIELADTKFPGQKPQHLIWNVDSEYEGQVMVEVTYFTSGLSWSMDYTAISDSNEKKMKFDGYVRVFNNSGEEYQGAEVRLIVGKINLVEKIADLARSQGLLAPPAPRSIEGRRYKRKAARMAFSKAESKDYASGEKKVVKEGLSEYFMFAIEGAETIKNGWSKRMRAVKAQNVEFDIVYRMRAHQYGARPVRFYLWQNDKKHGLGDSPMPNGKVRIFRENGKDGLSFLGEKDLRYVPIKAKIEVNLGPDDLVVYETKKRSSKRYNFHFRRGYVDGWDEEQSWIDTVRNYRDKPIVLELRRVWNGDVKYYSEIKTSLFDYRTIEVRFKVKAHGKRQYPCKVLLHMGTNKKQNRVKLKK